MAPVIEVTIPPAFSMRSPATMTCYHPFRCNSGANLHQKAVALVQAGGFGARSEPNVGMVTTRRGFQ